MTKEYVSPEIVIETFTTPTAICNDVSYYNNSFMESSMGWEEEEEY